MRSLPAGSLAGAGRSFIRPLPPMTPTLSDRSHRTTALRRFGAADADLDALLDYTANPFDLSGPRVLGDEPFVPVWADYLAEADAVGVFPVLQRVLPQLRFPVRDGISQTERYRAATRRGDLAGLGPDGLFEGGLRLVDPSRLRLDLHPTPAGRIPVLTAPVRQDFVALVQALTRRNEPTPLPDSMGALMVSGYNNWDRVRRYREAWEAAGGAGSWTDAFRELVPRRDQYQDRFILLSEGRYSAVPASALGFAEAEWLRVSHAIRREHESAHYYCRRALGAMQHNAFDEVLADAYGIVQANGTYRPDWHRRFLGLRGDGKLPEEGGRLWNYRADLSDGAFAALARLVDQAIDGLADSLGPAGASLEDAAALLRFLASRALLEWADTDLEHGPISPMVC